MPRDPAAGGSPPLAAADLGEYFSRNSRSRGERYRREGRVRLIESEDPLVRVATVSGDGMTYTVLFDAERRADRLNLMASCECPASDSNLCKHIWATLLALEDEGWLKSLGTPPRGGAILHLDAPDLFDHDVDDDIADAGMANRASADGGSRGRQGRRGLQRPKLEPDRLAWLERLETSRSGVRDYTEQRGGRPPKTQPLEPLYVLEERRPVYGETGVRIALFEPRTLANGQPGKPKALSLTVQDVSRMPHVADRTIALMLIGAGQPETGYGYYSLLTYGPRASAWRLTPALRREILPHLFATGRFHYRRLNDAESRPLRRDDGGPWEFIVSIEPAAGAKGGYVVRGGLARGDETTELRRNDWILDTTDPVWLVRDGRLGEVLLNGADDWLYQLNGGKVHPITRDDLPKLLKRLPHLQAMPRIQWPQEWAVQEVGDLAPLPQISFVFDPQAVTYAAKRDARAEVDFDYDGHLINPTDRSLYVVDADGGRMIRRDKAAEAELMNRVTSVGVRGFTGDGFTILERKLSKLVPELLNEGWRVLGNRALYRRAGDFSIRVTSGIDWFEVQGGVDFEGQRAELPALLAALRANEGWVQLGDGSFGMLPDEWLNRHRAWLELGKAEQGGVRFAGAQLGLIDALLADLPEVAWDENMAAAREKLRAFKGVKPRREPRGFAGTLRDYQRKGLGWLDFLRDFGWGGCLADDMGLGKTVQLLALLSREHGNGAAGPSLVVAPKSLVFNWHREAERFSPKLRVLPYVGAGRKEARAQLADFDLVLTTYGTLRRDVQHLREREFHYVVLDEAQAIKNPESKSAKAARLLRGSHRLVLTGTPVENHLGDLWSLFEFLNPGMLGSLPAFKGLTGVGAGAAANADNLGSLSRALRPFVLRRTKEQVAPELPPRSEQMIHCEMGKQQAAYYRELRDYYRGKVLAQVDEKGMQRSQMQVLEALLRLRQAACHPGLIDKSKAAAESAKLDSLLPMLRELIDSGHKALVFSQFTSLLSLVRAALDAESLSYEYLDGRTRNRPARVDRFQSDPTCPLFLISLKAGGVGLNLTAADYVFILDPWWNPAVEAQAIDRTHRIGQDKSVFAYRLITSDTVEARILELQQSKRDLADAIITADNSLVSRLTRSDLAMLLS